MKTHGGVEVQLHSFLTSTLDRGEGPASRPDRFNPPLTLPWKNIWLDGPQSSAGCFAKVENILPLSEFEPRTIQALVCPVWEGRTVLFCASGSEPFPYCNALTGAAMLGGPSPS